jgi:hypothetical protein
MPLLPLRGQSVSVMYVYVCMYILQNYDLWLCFYYIF